MQPPMLWFTLAGFVLGFAVSTLWEWLYYRGQRFTWREPQRYAPIDPPEISAFEEELLRPASTPDDSTAEYRSPGVFLESEQRPVLHYPPTTEPITTLTPEAWSSAWEVEQSYQPLHRASAETPRNEKQLIRPAPTIAYAVPNVVNPIYAPEEFPADEFSTGTLLGEEGESEEIPIPLAAAAPILIPELPSQTSTLLPAVATSAASAMIVVEPTVVAQPVISNAPSPVVAITPSAGEPSVQPIAPLAPKPNEHLMIAPAAVPLRRPVEHPDDLGKIWGIGEVYKQRLFAAGIYTWQQIVNSEPDLLRRITRAKPNADIGDWQRQAEALVKQFNRGGATYSGPPPDDLSLIDGIGPAVMESLYHGGITTFARLAATTPTELATILPAPAIGTEFHFADWIAQAAQRAQHAAAQAG